MGAQFRIDGLDKLKALINKLPNELKGKAADKMVKNALLPIQREARNLAPNGATGNLKKSIGFFAPDKVPRGMVAGTFVGPRYGRGFKGYAGHLVEDGTKERKPKKSRFLVFKTKDGKFVFAKSVKGVKARPFMAPAWESKKGNAENLLNKNAEKIINKVVAKYGSN